MTRVFLPNVFAGYEIHEWLERYAPNARLFRVRFVTRDSQGAVVYYR